MTGHQLIESVKLLTCLQLLDALQMTWKLSFEIAAAPLEAELTPNCPNQQATGADSYNPFYLLSKDHIHLVICACKTICLKRM